MLIVLALVLDFVNSDQDILFVGGERPGPGFAVLVASRLPKNPIGWIFCVVGLLYTAQRFTIAYADYALLKNIAFPWGECAAWFSSLIASSATLTLAILLMLLFPAGRLESRWWRIVAWATVLGAALSLLGSAFMPGILYTHEFVENPFGIADVIWGPLTTYRFFGISGVVGMTLLLSCLLAALASLILRLHHSRGDERQQVKWFLFAAVPWTLLISFIELDMIVANFTTDFMYYTIYLLYEWNLILPVNNLSNLTLLAVPICTYIAILRYNLYDIDVVINRTLVYGALTGCIVGIYVIAVVALGALFQTQGNLVVSLSATSPVAVVFQPLRSRLQRSVNRLM